MVEWLDLRTIFEVRAKDTGYEGGGGGALGAMVEAGGI